MFPGTPQGHQADCRLVDDIPKTRFATLDEDRIAYQVFGEGDVDLIYLSGVGDCIDVRWEWPSYANFLRRLSTHARVIMFDQRGSGASDNPSGESLPHWERWVDDARVVLDAVGSEGVVVFGGSTTGPTAILFAVTQPSRTKGLILLNTGALLRRSEPGEVVTPKQRCASSTRHGELKRSPSSAFQMQLMTQHFGSGRQSVSGSPLVRGMPAPSFRLIR